MIFLNHVESAVILSTSSIDNQVTLTHACKNLLHHLSSGMSTNKKYSRRIRNIPAEALKNIEIYF